MFPTIDYGDRVAIGAGAMIWTLVAIGALMVVMFESRNLWRMWCQTREITRRLKASMPSQTPIRTLDGIEAVEMERLKAVMPSQASPLTTAPATKANTLDAVWTPLPGNKFQMSAEDLARPIQTESITPPTPPLPPSDLPATPNGLVGPNSECAHIWRPVPQGLGTYQGGGQDQVLIYWHVEPDQSFKMRVWCRECGVSKWSDKILVPAAARTPSTSQKPDSQPSVQETTGAR